MSCGGPHEVDCADVLDRVYVFIDRELVVDEDSGKVSASSYEVIERHLHECAPCLKEYDVERMVKSLVARSCGAERASSDLKSKVLATLTDARSQVEFPG